MKQHFYLTKNFKSMKTMDLKTMGLIAGMCAITLTSCSTNDDPEIPEPEPSVLQGSITSDLTLKSGNQAHFLEFQIN